MKNLFFIISSLIFIIGAGNSGAATNNIFSDEASFDGLVFIGDTMEDVKQIYPDLELTYLEGWALVDTNHAYLFNDDGILVMIAKKLDNNNWDWVKHEGTKYEDDGYFLGKTRYEVTKGELLFTYYDNEDQDFLTLEILEKH